MRNRLGPLPDRGHGDWKADEALDFDVEFEPRVPSDFPKTPTGPQPTPTLPEEVFCDADRAFIARGESLGDLSLLDTFVQFYMTAWNIPNGALAVVSGDGRLVHAKGYTYPAAFTNGEEVFCAGPTTVFRAASLSKSHTAAGVMKLVQRGLLNLDDRLEDFVDLTPLGTGSPMDNRQGDIEIWHLLNHCAGWDIVSGRSTAGFSPLTRDFEIADSLGSTLPVSIDQIIQYMSSAFRLDHSPGTVREYSNYGYVLLGRLIETIAGRSLESFLSQHLWTPLGLSRLALASTSISDRGPIEVKYFSNGSFGYATVDRSPSITCTIDTGRGLASSSPYCCSVMHEGWASLWPYGRRNVENGHGSGSLKGAVVDLAKWAWQFTPRGRWGSPILSRNLIGQMTADPSTLLMPLARTGSQINYGYGWYIQSDGSVAHSGHMEGTAARIYAHAQTGGALDNVCICALFNRNVPHDFGAAGQSAENAFNRAITGQATLGLNQVVNWGGVDDLFPNYGL